MFQTSGSSQLQHSPVLGRTWLAGPEERKWRLWECFSPAMCSLMFCWKDDSFLLCIVDLAQLSLKTSVLCVQPFQIYIHIRNSKSHSQSQWCRRHRGMMPEAVMHWMVKPNVVFSLVIEMANYSKGRHNKMFLFCKATEYLTVVK